MCLCVRHIDPHPQSGGPEHMTNRADRWRAARFAILACVYTFGVITIIASGGALLTKWECGTGSCLPREQATNKCLAQANSAFARSSGKRTIWEQCMRGEGFQEVPCARGEQNPNCHL